MSELDDINEMIRNNILGKRITQDASSSSTSRSTVFVPNPPLDLSTLVLPCVSPDVVPSYAISG